MIYRFVYRSDPKFWRFRIIELLQIRECQLRGEEHDRQWWNIATEPEIEESNTPVNYLTAQERDNYIVDHADYFTVAFRIGYDKKTVRYRDLDTAISRAAAAANFLRRNVLIYAVMEPNQQAYVGSVHYNKGKLTFHPGRDGKVKDGNKHRT